MSWIALTLDGDLVAALDESSFGNLRGQELTTPAASDLSGNPTDEDRRFQGSLQKLRTELQGHRALGAYAASFGINAFFDAIAVNADVLDDVKQALAYAYAWLYFTQMQMTAGDINEVRAKRMETMLKASIAALSNSVPVALGVLDEAPGGGFVSMHTTVLDTLGRDNFSDSDANTS